MISNKIEKLIEKIVDQIHGKKVDIFCWVSYFIISIATCIVMWIIKRTIQSDDALIPNIMNTYIYLLLIIYPLGVYYVSLMGKFFSAPSRRVSILVFSVFSTMVFVTGYIIQLTNLSFSNWVYSINNIDVIPSSLMIGNVRLVTFGVPLLIICPMAGLILQIISDKDIKKEIRKYEVELLLPTVFEENDVSIDIKLCKDFDTGKDCIVPEKKMFEHVYLQGGTGSGKTSTFIIPFLEQLFYLKAEIREGMKKIAYSCLEDNIAIITKPITNNWFNKNFNINMIEPREGNRDEFIKRFEKYIIGIRDYDEKIIDKKSYGGVIELPKISNDDKYKITINILKNNMELEEKTVEYTNKLLSLDICYESSKTVSIMNSQILKDIKDDNKKVDEILNNDIVNEEYDDENVLITLPELDDNNLVYHVIVNKHGSGKIIFRNLGLCVIAPDEGLPAEAVEIAKKYGFDIHNIDPTMSSIKRGVSKFNPLKGGRSDKTGDIISSIFVGMDNAGGSNKGNSYFTNASVRAIRNTIILLKEMHPILYGNEPTLKDVYDCISDPSKVIPYVEAMKNDKSKKVLWSSVISYFVINFYPPKVDDKNNVIRGATQGSQRKKTEEAIGGIINQLDNFITRKEVSHILCDNDNSIDLYEALENGDCIAIATRQNELGERLGKAFAMFFILSIQNVVLSRFSEMENPEIPFYLIIDEFDFYINENTKVFFTFARKYKCSVTIALQGMSQLDSISEEFRKTIFTNTSTKILLPGSELDDRKHWSEYLGYYKNFEMQTGIMSTSVLSDSPKYSETHRGTMKEESIISEKDIQDLHFKEAIYVYTNKKGRLKRGKGITDFVQMREDPNKSNFNFEKFNPVHEAEKLLSDKPVQETIEEVLDIELTPNNINTSIATNSEIPLEIIEAIDNQEKEIQDLSLVDVSNLELFIPEEEGSENFSDENSMEISLDNDVLILDSSNTDSDEIIKKENKEKKNVIDNSLLLKDIDNLVFEDNLIINEDYDILNSESVKKEEILNINLNSIDITTSMEGKNEV
ncbi:MAG: type IV secretory system conjugative DNA transfer family protein [Tissierellales bacterium]|nr:type IV secretory system conjugative DNA transfer family protein [Tissierellales bacterium]